MAIRVNKHPVFCRVCPTPCSPDDMVNVPRAEFRDVLLADRADPLLFFPQIQQFPPTLERLLHFDAQPSLKVRLPRRVEGVGCSFHFDMTTNRNPAGAKQDEILAVYFTVKDPMPTADGAVIALFDPSAAFVWVSAFRPSPKRLKDGVVYGSKGVFTRAVLVVMRPATNDRVEQLDQPPSAGLSVAFDDRSNFRQQARDALF